MKASRSGAGHLCRLLTRVPSFSQTSPGGLNLVPDAWLTSSAAKIPNGGSPFPAQVSCIQRECSPKCGGRQTPLGLYTRPPWAVQLVCARSRADANQRCRADAR